jgi:hypothetical protein
MPLKVFTTGLDQYAAGGDGRIKLLVIGGPNAGKTRLASYFPKPIFADADKGLASIRDRRSRGVLIGGSADMFDLLAELDRECKRPWDQRAYQTLVIDTFDVLSRKVADEWVRADRARSVFSGWEAYDYLAAKLGTIMTRTLNLDMHVVVNCHFTDKTVKGPDETGKIIERTEYGLQVRGSMRDQLFNDFDLIGWLGLAWENEDGRQVLRRELSFTPAPDKPFLKDRLHVMPPAIPITLGQQDFATLFGYIAGGLDNLPEAEQVGEIPTGSTLDDTAAPAPVTAGALPGAATAAPPRPSLVGLDRPTLMNLAREYGGNPRATATKSELLDIINRATEARTRATTSPASTPSPEPTPAPNGQHSERAPAPPTAPPAAPPVPTPAAPQPTPAAATGAIAPAPAPATLEPVAADPAPPVSREKAVNAVLEQLGASILSETPELNTAAPVVLPTTPAGPPAAKTPAVVPPAPAVVPVVTLAPVSAAAAPQVGAVRTATGAPSATDILAGHCDSCAKALAAEEVDLVRIGRVKFRRLLCNSCFKTLVEENSRR